MDYASLDGDLQIMSCMVINPLRYDGESVWHGDSGHGRGTAMMGLIQGGRIILLNSLVEVLYYFSKHYLIDHIHSNSIRRKI